jgi:hypothetical protein
MPLPDQAYRDRVDEMEEEVKLLFDGSRVK